MKFKSIFLGMLGMAAIVSCNNESVIDPESNSNNSGVDNSGSPTYMTIGMNQGQAKTYGGSSVEASETAEKAISDAVVYVYKSNSSYSSAEAEAIAYVQGAEVTDVAHSTATWAGANPEHVTLKVISGFKKIYVAVNTGGTTNLVDNSDVKNHIAAGTSTFTLHPDTGVPYDSTVTLMNKMLVSNATGFTRQAVLAFSNVEGGSAGLVRTLSGGVNGGAGMLTKLATVAYPTSTRFFMSSLVNGNDSLTSGGSTYYTSCNKQLVPNITAKVAEEGAEAQNHFVFGVQRAVAKISVRITANGATPSTTPAFPYESSETDGSKGKFTPWASGGAAATNSGQVVWALGGINKREYPFQVFNSTGAVASPNYDLLAAGDTLIPATPATSDKWYDSYDNTRVFGTGKKYYTSTNDVTNVKTSMTNTANCLLISPAPGVYNTMNFAFATENGTEYPQLHDRGTFAIIGGVYQPENFMNEILQAPVTTNPPHKGWNGAAAENTFAVGTPVNTYGPTYTAPSYSGGELDTMYYLTDDKVFILGKTNVIKYLAWDKGLDKTVTAGNLNATNAPATFAALDALTESNGLLSYFKGICWYRMWVREPALAGSGEYANEVLVRRNHIYDINVTKIKGPGIGDPNKIIVPGQPIPDLETFVTAEITVLDWHKVNQDYEGTFE